MPVMIVLIESGQSDFLVILAVPDLLATEELILGRAALGP